MSLINHEREDLPFQLTRWDSLTPPTREMLQYWLRQEKLVAEQLSLPVGYRTEEIKFSAAGVELLFVGKLQISFPGYGVIEMNPGDCLEIEANTTYEILNIFHGETLLLRAFRS
jgi:hypothetical protein